MGLGIGMISSLMIFVAGIFAGRMIVGHGESEHRQNFAREMWNSRHQMRAVLHPEDYKTMEEFFVDMKNKAAQSHFQREEAENLKKAE